MITTTPLTFAEFKRLVNSIDESHWGTALVVCDGRSVMDLASVSGLPACDNRFHGKQPATPSRIELVLGDRVR